MDVNEFNIVDILISVNTIYDVIKDAVDTYMVKNLVMLIFKN
jgi:hypothetical protein